MTDICPTCGASRGAHLHGNNTCETTTLEVPTHLLAVLAKAVQIGSTTAMMCQAYEAQNGLEDFRAQVQDKVPSIASLFDRYQWFALCHRALAGVPINIRLADDGYQWNKRLWIEVVDPNNTAWPGHHRTAVMKTDDFDTQEAAESALQQLQDEIARLLPMKA